MPKKPWKYFTTNYRDAWNKYRKSDGFKLVDKILKEKRIKQPFRNNIQKAIFTEGFLGSGVEIKVKE